MLEIPGRRRLTLSAWCDASERSISRGCSAARVRSELGANLYLDLSLRAKWLLLRKRQPNPFAVTSNLVVRRSSAAFSGLILRWHSPTASRRCAAKRCLSWRTETPATWASLRTPIGRPRLASIFARTLMTRSLPPPTRSPRFGPNEPFTDLEGAVCGRVRTRPHSGSCFQ
jgi:hypothetical protein